MKFRFNTLTYDVPDGVDIVVESGWDGSLHVVDFEFVQGNEIVSAFGPEGKTWAGVGIKQVVPTERCVSCGRPIKLGEEWCPAMYGGTPCETDLRDSNNRVKIDNERALGGFGLVAGQYLGQQECPYARRWIAEVFGYSVRLHHFYRSDDERANHDHPWWFVTLILRGTYMDVSDCGDGTRTIQRMSPGTIRYRPAHHRHTVRVVHDVSPHGVWTVIVTGRNERKWGFWLRRPDGSFKFVKSNKYFLTHGHHLCDQP